MHTLPRTPQLGMAHGRMVVVEAGRQVMTRIAALYDIHGNAPALAAVLNELRAEHVDLVVVGGDVFPGPLAVDCLELLEAFPVPKRWIAGNGDRDTAAASRGEALARVPEAFHSALRWCAEDAGAERMSVVAEWPDTHREAVASVGTVLFCHATPHDDHTIFTELTPDALIGPLFEGLEAEVVVCGHTHMQFDRTVREVRVLNAGSVGMPFGASGAFWLVISPTGVVFRRTEYDLAAAARSLGASRYPLEMDPAAPPARDQMLATFERAAEQQLGWRTH